jgi:hypothetical protein
MENLARFMAYAADFEKTYVDDDWSRLHQYFAPDAVYEVKSEDFGCSLQGAAAIFKGIKKSLDNFDRKFDDRSIAVTNGPHVDGERLSADWTVTYTKAGKTPYPLRGHTDAYYRDGKIVRLVDSYDASVGPEAAAWMKQNGMTVDPSYV